MRLRCTRRLTAGAAMVVASALVFGCAWTDADRGRNTDHDPPAGEESWDPNIEDPAVGMATTPVAGTRRFAASS
jgi:hypothetical protein